MSKPVTHEEVEDVLSSIRRLVSEDKRPLAGLRSAPALAPAGAAPQQTPEQTAGNTAPGRLVLTPALRVAPVSEDHADEMVASPADLAPLDLGSVAQQAWHPEPMASVGEDTASDLDSPAQDAAVADAEEDPDLLVDGDYGDESYWDTQEEPTHGADGALPDETGDAEAVQTSDFRPVMPHIEPDHVTVAAAIEADRQSADPAEPTDKVVPLTAKIAALEAAMSGIVQDWEPDGDDADDLTGPDAPAMAWEDDVDLDATGAPFETAQASTFEAEPDEDAAADATFDDEEDTPETPIGAAFGGDDQLMDEDALRDLVSEIVRAELQGALGERITRNVRKLVRREIHRALTAQELE
jgi:hypothetical protein